MPFTFKQFHVDDSQCGMPVSTDGVLLGAWAPLEQARRVLDIGTGSGLLALMAAQRSDADIQAVEPEPAAATQAAANFAASPWVRRLQLWQGPIQAFEAEGPFDAILCNPPYFTSGERSARSSARAQARHVDSLDYADLVTALVRLLASDGHASLILPWDRVPVLLAEANEQGLHAHRICQVRTRAHKAPNRGLLWLGKSPAEADTEQLCIHGDQGYSSEYRRLTQDFYLKMGSQ